MKIHRIHLCLILLQISSIFAQELAGCGGFVKSNIKETTKLDYSSIKVKIVTKGGALKEVTEVAPTGYYYIPIYDKGTFYVKVSGPEGYHFDPNQVEVVINEENKCLSNNAEQDINFHLTGFTVTGHVTSDGCSGGPADIQVEIPNIAKTTTDSTGKFTLTNVPPGSYKIHASHPQYTFQTSELDAQVQWGNLVLSKSFTIKGYSISGTVLSSGSPVRNVEFHLYTSTGYRCPVPGNSDAQCVATTSETGVFTFNDVPCGAYRLVPVYSTFDVIPKEKTVQVTSGNVEIEEKFVVKGFSLNGRVVSGDKGVAGVTIKVNGQKTHVTDNNGFYTLDQLNNGVYTIQAEKEHLHFTEISNLRISPGSTLGELPNITVKSYDVCGKIILSQVPAGVSISSPRSVVLQDMSANEVARSTSDSNGAFCFAAAPGSYKVSVALSKQEQQLGLLVNPQYQQVSVSHAPVLDILFSQARVSVSGTVTCLEKPCDVTVSMTTPSSHLSATLVDNTFNFQNVLPGTYQVQVENSKWCWNHDSVQVEVSIEDVTGIEFTQTGYRAEITSDTAIQVEIDGKSSKLEKGKNSVCVANTGKHTLVPKEKCYKFNQDSYTFDSTSPTTITVTHYKISGSIQSDIPDLSFEITPSRPVDIKGREYSFWGEYQETYTVSPRSSSLLFYPHSHKVTVNKPCVTVPSFDARPGIYIDASVEPAMDGVTFSVRAEEDDTFVRHVVSTSTGKVKIGPLYDTMKYKLTAVKDGYAVTQKSETHFVAKKLGRVMVNILDNATPIAGALLSLSGEGYRSNNMTNNDGKFSFMNLSPGDYYLRPVLKEYVFDPSSKSITVTDGGDHSVTIKATRVAWSAYGQVKTLSGEPEKQVTVEAIGDNGEYEQTQTDSNGSFRIRGLVPNTKYRIVAKTGERTSPSEITEIAKSQDITNLEFIVFKKNAIKVYGTVNTPAEHISSVNLVLKGEDSQQTSQLTVANYFEFKNVKNGNYKLIAKSNLNTQYYEHSVQEIPIIVENEDVHLTVNYTISFKAEHMHDISAAPVFALFFGAALIAVIFYNAQIMQFVKDAREGKYAIGRKSSNDEVDEKSEWIPGLNKTKKSKKRF